MKTILFAGSRNHDLRPAGVHRRRAGTIAAMLLVIAAIIAASSPSSLADSATILMRRVDAALRANRNLNGAGAYIASPSVVVLYGKVFDEKDRVLAEQTAGKVHGVKQVINTLRTSTGQWLEEESRINDTLLLNGFENVSVRVIGPEAYLSGQVTTESDKQRAVTVIQSVSNLQVVNFLRVVPGPMFSTPILLIAALCGALGPKSNCRNDQLAPELPMSAAAVWVCR